MYRKRILAAACAAAVLTAGISAAAYGDIIEIRHELTVDEITEMAERYQNDGIYDTMEPSFAEEPNYTAPYSAGTLSDRDLGDAMNATSMVRFLAGVPYENITLDELETQTAQHKAVLMAATDFSHSPAQPSDMSDEFYQTANRYSSECIAAASWKASVSSRVLSWIEDTGENNIEHVGHRMILLRPGAYGFGFGAANYENAQWLGLYSAHVSYGSGEIDTYVAWPNSGAFPIEYFDPDNRGEYANILTPWSINLGIDYSEAEKNNIELRLTRERDGMEWVFDKNTPDLSREGSYTSDMHLSTDSIYGNSVVFRPDPESLGEIRDGDIFTVELSGIYYADGEPAELAYSVEFFDLTRALDPESAQIILTIGSTQALVFGETVFNDVAPKVVNDRTMLPARFVAENLGAYVYWDGYEQKVTVSSRDKEIYIYIGSSWAEVNGERVSLDSPAFVENDRTYLPLRFISEELGADVDWDGSSQTVTITAP